jgi:hypothetical protein
VGVGSLRRHGEKFVERKENEKERKAVEKGVRSR